MQADSREKEVVFWTPEEFFGVRVAWDAAYDLDDDPPYDDEVTLPIVVAAPDDPALAEARWLLTFPGPPTPQQLLAIAEFSRSLSGITNLVALYGVRQPSDSEAPAEYRLLEYADAVELAELVGGQVQDRQAVGAVGGNPLFLN
ncbi:MAG: hypothetical protein ACT6RU_14410 [Aliihoeflea sp.]|uniref:hypothetical protein n=1 Tax=Aliihoeflea sp. TaxID=2608088 RepID=UPI0040332D92